MARRKTTPTKKTKADRKDAPKPQAGYGDWQSVGSTHQRRIIFGSAPQDLRRDLKPYDRLAMVKKCRWAERNSGLFRQILGDMVLYTVGDGIRPQSHAEDAEKAKRYEEYFHEKTKRLDVTNRFSFYQCQSVLLRAMVRDGDAFAAKVRNGAGQAKVQLIEAHRVADDPNVEPPEGQWDGVGFGPFGELRYFNVIRSDGSSRQILANAMMHVVDHEYASGARGVPMMQHSINSIQDEMEILALEKMAVKDNSDVTRVIKKAGGTVDGDMAFELGASVNATYDNLSSQMGGKLIALEPGEDFQSFASNRPNPTFTGFLAALEKDVSMGVLPYEFVNDPSKIGGASVRLVTAKSARVFGKYQTVLIDSFCIPTWGYIIGQGIANGDLPDDPKWNVTSWTTPKSVTVDAGREAAQDRADLELGLMSLSEMYGQRGLDFKQEAKKRADDMVYLMNLAKENGLPLWMLYKPGFNWLQQGQNPDQTPDEVSQNLNLAEPPPANPNP